MNVSELFIRRPVATTLLMIALLLAGMLAYGHLPVSALPEVDYPTIQVRSFYPGAGPEVMASSITAPLERQFGQMPGLTQMNSDSAYGASIITLQFALNLSLDVAEQQVQAGINGALSYLPRDMPNPPTYSKVNPADAPIMTLALYSAGIPLTRVQDLADTRFAQKISQAPGVGMVSLSGGQRPAVRIHANLTALAAYGLSLEELRGAISLANVNMAKGSFDGPRQSFTITSNDQLFSSEEYKPLIVAYRNEAPVRLADVAEVLDAAEDERQAAWMNDRPAVIMNIQRQPGANVIAVADRIRSMLPQLRASLPPDVTVEILTDRTTGIRASVKDVQFELVLAVALVVAVIYIFLRRLPATVIPGVAVPLSLVGTFGVMYLMNFSLSNLSLMALTISTGFVVDDAIVMIENIARYTEKGESPLQAALDGARQIGFTIISLTFSLVAVLIPLLFMGDITGRLFREFSITLGASILISAAISLTLTPMMCARLLKNAPEERESKFHAAVGAAFERITSWYGRTLRVVLQHQPLTLCVAVGTLLLTLLLYVTAPKGLFPLQDTGVLIGISEAPQSVSFAAMSERQQALAAVILRDPAVQSLSSFIGVDGVNTSLNVGRVQILLKEYGRRPSAEKVMERLRRELDKVPGVRLHLQAAQDLSVDMRQGRTTYQYSLDSTDQAMLNHWAPRLEENLSRRPELRSVSSDQQSEGKRVFVQIDRIAASRLGITPQQIDGALYDAFGQRQISTIFAELNQYRVVLSALPSMRTGPEALSSVYIRSADGKQTPLAAVASFSEQSGPLVISRQGQFPVVTFGFDAAPGYALGDAVDAVRQANLDSQLPPILQGRFQGAANAFLASLDNQTFLILAALVTVYIVLGV
ncbi:MAG: efflux RND transporter permease subunit, partial [Deltaproteobacteria bacterium]|nr:efflux RND transporter permease subunit [Deltaproteobacteria bacterium]